MSPQSAEAGTTKAERPPGIMKILEERTELNKISLMLIIQVCEPSWRVNLNNESIVFYCVQIYLIT